MDQKNQRVDRDLPEPIRRPLSFAEKRERDWKLVSTFLTFVAAYSVLHKCIIPFGLKFTTLNDSPYSLIDFWFLHPLLFAFLLRRSKENGPIISFLAGVAIVYGIYEIYMNFQGRYTGWLMFSRLLSSVPLAIGAGYLMTLVGFGRSLRTATYGALCFGVYAFIVENFRISEEIEKKPLDVVKYETTTKQSICGSQELVVKPGSEWFEGPLMIKKCGFSHSLLSLENNVVEVVNELDISLNLHLFVHEKGKTKSSWNLMLPARSRVKTKPISLSEEGIAMLISDSIPEVGIVAFTLGNPTRKWLLKRKPISIENLR